MTTKGEDSSVTWDAWFEQLRATCREYEQRNEIQHLYLLADSRQDPDLVSLLKKVPEVRWTSLWDGLDIETYADIAPYLIYFDDLTIEDAQSFQHRLLKKLWSESDHRYMLTWIWSAANLSALSKHLRRYCRYQLPDNRAFYLHFYDNRILERLRKVWSEEEQKRFIGPCTQISYRNRSLEQIIWHKADGHVPKPVEVEQVISAEQHAALLHLGYPDKLVRQLQKVHANRLDHLSPNELYRQVSQQLERTARYQIEDDVALLNYVAIGITTSPHFDEHPVIQARLTDARHGKLTFDEALDQIDDQVWDQLKSEMNETR